MRAFLSLSTALLTLTACGEPAPAAAPAGKATASAEPSGTPPLDAGGAPRLRPGYYEVVQTDDGEAPRTTHECVGEEANAKMRDLLAGQSSPDCKVTRATGAGGLQVASECRRNGMTNHLKLAVAGSDTAYKMTLSIRVTTPDGKTTTSQSLARGRWIGACPAGLAPGQTLEDQ